MRRYHIRPPSVPIKNNLLYMNPVYFDHFFLHLSLLIFSFFHNPFCHGHYSTTIPKSIHTYAISSITKVLWMHSSSSGCCHFMSYLDGTYCMTLFIFKHLYINYFRGYPCISPSCHFRAKVASILYPS